MLEGTGFFDKSQTIIRPVLIQRFNKEGWLRPRGGRVYKN
jgi:hypothetical protein